MAKPVFQQKTAPQTGGKEHNGKRLGILNILAKFGVQKGGGISFDTEDQCGQKKESGQEGTFLNYVTGPEVRFRHKEPPFDSKIQESSFCGKGETMHLLDDFVVCFRQKETALYGIIGVDGIRNRRGNYERIVRGPKAGHR